MAAQKYIDEEGLERAFDTFRGQQLVAKGINAMPRPRTQREFEILTTRVNFVENSALSGFADVKMIECVTETYLQTLLLLVMYSRDSYDGIVNFEIFGSENEWSKRLFFYMNGIWSFISMTAGLVSFVFEGENKSFGLKNRIFLILVYVIQAMISLYNLLSLMSLRLRSESIGYLNARMIVMGFFASRMLVLMAYSFLSSAGKKRPLTRKIYFLVANLNLPVHFESFQNDKDRKNAKIQTYTEFIFLWTLNIIENIIRSVCVLMLASDEVMSQTLLHFRKTDLLLATISGEILVFILISFYFWIHRWREASTNGAG